MRKSILLLAAMAACMGFGCGAFESEAFAAGWSLTLDTPLSFTFSNANASSPAPGNSAATWQNRTTTDVSGSKVLLIAPFHVGVGYEDYSFVQKLDYPSQGGGVGTARISTNIRIYDLVVDVPMEYLNLTLGYGQGTANTDIEAVSGGGVGQSNPNPIRDAKVTQTFVVVGIPLGARVDIHLGYHWVTIEDNDIVSPGNNPGPHDQTQQSGQMLSAGLRLNF